MDALDVSVLVSLVKPGGSRWTVEAAIVTRLAQLRGGGWCWAAQAAEWTGADEVVCRRALRSLEERRIIKRDPGDTGRDNIRWCGVNDDWRRWQVEWLVDASQVAAQLALAGQQRNESPLTRVFARSLGARSLRRIARSFDARSWEEDMDEVAGIARSGIARSGKPAPTDRAVQIARSLGRRRAVLERAIRGDGPSGGSPSGVSVQQAPPPTVRTRSEEERSQDLGAMALMAKILVLSIPAPNARDKWLSGPPLRRFNDLVEELGIEHVDDAISELVPGVSSPVRNVEKLAAMVRLSKDERVAPVAPAPDAPPAPEYFKAEPVELALLEERRGIIEALRSSRRPGWQDDAGSGEDPEAIAQ